MLPSYAQVMVSALGEATRGDGPAVTVYATVTVVVATVTPVMAPAPVVTVPITVKVGELEPRAAALAQLGCAATVTVMLPVELTTVDGTVTTTGLAAAKTGAPPFTV